jgi:hypothetical protein
MALVLHPFGPLFEDAAHLRLEGVFIHPPTLAVCVNRNHGHVFFRLCCGLPNSLTHVPSIKLLDFMLFVTFGVWPRRSFSSLSCPECRPLRNISCLAHIESLLVSAGCSKGTARVLSAFSHRIRRRNSLGRRKMVIHQALLPVSSKARWLEK